MYALVITILLNYPQRPLEMYFTHVEIFDSENRCDQRLRSALNAEQSKLPQAIVRAACVKAEAAP